MSSWKTATLGGTQYSPSSTYGNGTDYTSGFTITDATLSGACSLTTGLEIGNYPLVVNNITLYLRASAANNIQLELDNTAAPGGANRASETVTGTSTSPSFNPDWADFTDTVLWAGFRKLNANSVLWYREAAKSGSISAKVLNGSSGYGIYRDGSLETSFSPSAASQKMQIGWNTVPTAPTSLTGVSSTPTSVTLSWGTVSDDGNSTVNGYRVLYKTSAATTWTVYTGTGTTLGKTSTNPLTIDGLTANTVYNFKVAATNGVSDNHNSDYTSADAVVGTNASISVTTLAGGPKIYDAGWNPSEIKVYDAGWQTATMKVYDGTAWQTIN
jgi:hypothetical protein